MTELTIRKTGEDTAEFELPEGCPVCGNTVSVRVTPAGAHTCCLICHWLSKPQIEFSDNGLKVAYPAIAQA